MKILSIFVTIFLTGCPFEKNDSHCDKFMYCEQEKEMICDRVDTGCGEECHYYVVEHCYERCAPE